MENMVMENLFDRKYSGKKVLITGHTGFKGSWLAYWLLKMGANVIGFSDQILEEPNHYNLLDLENQLISVTGNINDESIVKNLIDKESPDIVFHLAAQPLVRLSYKEPIDTLKTNIIGTANLLEAVRASSVKGVIIVTTDKCYENKELGNSFIEEDKLGGYDPYSASKAAAEIIVSAYRNSFFNLESYGKKHNTLLATARAGNVIGGGDWASDRLIPDLMRNASNRTIVEIRSPYATRPWQHVLEPLAGYLLLGQRLLEGKKEFASSWNFGPTKEGSMSVGEIVGLASDCWSAVQFEISEIKQLLHEAKFLHLDCSKAANLLKWQPLWSTNTSVSKTIEWYKKFYVQSCMNTKEDLLAYVKLAIERNAIWAL